MEPIQDPKKFEWLTNTDYIKRLEAENAALRFSEREWRDKAQDKIAECLMLERQCEELRDRIASLAAIAPASFLDLEAERNRLVAERDRLTKEMRVWRAETYRLRAERDRLIQALERIADYEDSVEAEDCPTLRTIAREALTKKETS